MRPMQVLLPLPFDKAFTYHPPSGEGTPPLGSVVRVPFGRREELGIVWSEESEAGLDAKKIKHALAVCPVSPIPASLMRFIDWVADYTLTPKGMVLKMALSVPEACDEPKTIAAFRRKEGEEPSPMTAARRKVWESLAGGEALSVMDIAEKADVSAEVVRTMARHNWLEMVSAKAAGVHLDGMLPQGGVIALDTHFSAEQQHAIDTLKNAVEGDAFAPFLLDGVTGSGKTEVYFAAIETALKQDKQVLVLLPEITLSVQWLSRFEQRFGFAPAVWHSGISRARKRDTWREVLNNKIKLVIGARSALFLPFPNLGLVVVDEEHDGSYKQEEGQIYHARDMAILRGRLEACPVVLVSATPSLETTENIAQGRYKELKLTERHAGAAYPEVILVDMKQVPRGQWLSPELRQATARALEEKRQVMLFLNRRGYAPLTLCRACGHRFECPQCTAWLVAHEKRKGARDDLFSTSTHRLFCHHCGYNAPLPNECPACHADDSLVICGPGVERVAEEAQKLFPTARVSIMTSDTVELLDQAQSLVEAMAEGNIDILVGTQMMAKGHHFPKLALVGVIDADIGLSGGDLRASERSYQLLHQIAGRAGREDDRSLAVVQSYQPDHPVMQAMILENRDGFIACEAAARKRANMPPYSRLVALILSGKKEQEVKEAAYLLAKRADFVDAEGIRLFGPAPAPLYQLRGRYRYRLLIRADKTINIQKTLRHWLANTPLPNSVAVKVDIDPYGFM